MQIAPMHTAEEMQSFSNFAHVVEGTILAAVALIVLVQSAGYLTRGRYRYLWPGIILLAGLFLLGFLLIPYHGFAQAPEQWRFIFGDAQQRQHLILAVLTAIAGAFELRARSNSSPGHGWSLAWPAALVIAGLMFALHRQHGTGEAVRQAVVIHRYLGLLLILTGVLRVADIRSGFRSRWLAFGWGAALLAAAVLLGSYREPPGAYHSPATGMQHSATRSSR